MSACGCDLRHADGGDDFAAKAPEDPPGQDRAKRQHGRDLPRVVPGPEHGPRLDAEQQVARPGSRRSRRQAPSPPAPRRPPTPHDHPAPRASRLPRLLPALRRCEGRSGPPLSGPGARTGRARRRGRRRRARARPGAATANASPAQPVTPRKFAPYSSRMPHPVSQACVHSSDSGASVSGERMRREPARRRQHPRRRPRQPDRPGEPPGRARPRARSSPLGPMAARCGTPVRPTIRCPAPARFRSRRSAPRRTRRSAAAPRSGPRPGRRTGPRRAAGTESVGTHQRRGARSSSSQPSSSGTWVPT